MYRTDFWTLCEKARVGCSERIALKQVYYQGWNRSPAQVGCMRQVLRAGALGRPRGMGWGGRWEGGLRWRTHVNPWLIHVNIWQKPLQYCKVISLQLIKINGKKWKKKKVYTWNTPKHPAPLTSVMVGLKCILALLFTRCVSFDKVLNSESIISLSPIMSSVKQESLYLPGNLSIRDKNSNIYFKFNTHETTYHSHRSTKLGSC